MARYRKIDPRIWNDEKFRSMSDNGKLAFLFLLTHPHMTALGAMRATIAGLAEELGWGTEAFREAFAEALLKGMAEHDPKACLIALPNFIRYNSPESPNVVKAWVGALDLLPECLLKIRTITRAKAFAEALPEAFAKALPEAFAKGMPYQEQEQEQLTLGSSDQGKKRTGDDPEGFTECWDEYPKREGGNSRKEASKAYAARLREGASPEDLLAGVRRYGAFVRAKSQEGTSFVKQASTFFGPGEHWREAWAVSPSAEGNEVHQGQNFRGAI